MGIVKSGGDNEFAFGGSGTTITAPLFFVPDTSGSLVISVHITGVSDCQTTGS